MLTSIDPQGAMEVMNINRFVRVTDRVTILVGGSEAVMSGDIVIRWTGAKLVFSAEALRRSARLARPIRCRPPFLST